ncbi:MAG: hypothetical protein MRZ79_02890 [Bacteroidia bacterium]|nr:hypothetical protein [Bacteroidia bacterium]
MKITFLLFCLSITCSSGLLGQSMNNSSLEKVLTQQADSLAGSSGQWQILVKDLMIYVLTDEANNRMRMIAPIIYEEDLTDEMKTKALIANFHTALDVKYAISEGVVWTAYIHPLKELSESQVVDAVKQVYQATATFGYTYSSTDLVFPAPGARDEDDNE